MAQTPLQVNIFSELHDPYDQNGLSHFMKVYGLNFTNDRQNADIWIGYSVPKENNYRAIIILDSQAHDEVCYLKIQNEIIPMFKRPVELSGGQILVSVANEAKEYACVTVDNNIITIGFNIFREIGKILCGYYDNYFLRKDNLGITLRNVPIIDVVENMLSKVLYRILLPRSIKRFKWPDDHKFVLILTHDVDRIYKNYQYLSSILSAVKKIDLPTLGYHLKNLLFRKGIRNPYWTFDIICKLENDLGVKSSFYFLNEKGKYNPFNIQSWILYKGIYNIESLPIKKVIKELHEKGFEIGVHGSYHSYCNLELLKNEKHLLESIVCSNVNGVRQHWLNYDNTITPDIQNRIGFNYDTSIGFNPDIGIGLRRGTCFPFQLMLSDLSISPLLEIPLMIMDGDLDSVATSEDCFKLMSQVEKYGGVLTILWHTQRFNQHEFPGMVNIYKDIINEAKSRGAWITTANEVYKWITE